MSKRTSRKMLISLMVIMLIGVLATSANAGTAYVYINKGQGPQLSNAISLPAGAEYEGWNYSDSGHKLYLGLQVYSRDIGWGTMRTALMEIDGYAYGTYPMPHANDFRVQLNPQWAYTDCHGKGLVRDL